MVLVVKNPPDTGLIPELGRFPEGGKGNPLQYSYLENPTDRGARWATVDGVAECWTRLKRLSMHAQEPGSGSSEVTKRNCRTSQANSYMKGE